MKFQITFELMPASAFGVPQDNVTALPGKSNYQYFGDTYHTATMTLVGYGSLSEYRTEKEAINLSFSLGKERVNMHDNFLFIEIEAATPHEAYDQTVEEIGNFLQHLSLSHGGLFTYRPLIIENEDGKTFPLPQYNSMGNISIYNLEHLRHHISEAQKYNKLTDLRLERALKYLGHARFLFVKRMQIADPLSEHFTMLIASIYLNLWKAASTVVGDPSNKEDSDYKNRYKKYGFDEEYFNTKIEKIRKLRNNYDVAHYTLADERINDIEKNFGEAETIVVEILQHYRDFLLNEISNSQNQTGDA